MKPKDLLFQLTQLEHTLNDFSFEELTAAEATYLKKSFRSFKTSLENKILTPSSVLGGLTNNEIEEKPKPKEIERENSTTTNADELVAKVSHEIRTPLNGIIGFTDLLKEDKLTKKQLERVDAIQTASYSLLNIINELLEFSKLSAGLETFEYIDFNLKNVIENVVYLCKTLVNDKNIILKTAVDERIPNILMGDPSKLSQILLNLIGNAIKFVEEGTIALKVNLKHQNKNYFDLEFLVEDTGIGIAADKFETIFDSFKQAEDNTQALYGGTGLGLNIVKQIIEKLNGTISVSSQIGLGSTFRFTVGYQKGKLPIHNTEVTDDDSTAEVEAIQGMKILVFEDNILNQKLIAQRLNTWKCKTYVTDNALYGVNLLETNDIDLVLMDLKMPFMNGFEVTQQIRKSFIKAVRSIPIIAISADFSSQDEIKCQTHQINDFILKPFSPDELLTKLVKNKNRMNTRVKFESKLVDQEIEVYSDATKINLAKMLEDCMGQMNLLEQLVNLYKQNALEFIGVLKMNLENDNLSEIEFAAHKIKSGLAMMQSKSLYDLAVQIQQVCKAGGDRNHLKILHNRFIDEYPFVVQAIDKQINALKTNS